MPSFASLLRCLPVLASLLTSVNADPPPFHPAEADEYDKGGYGLYPEIKYKTTDLVGAHILRRKWDAKCGKDGKYIFFAPRGMIIGHPGPMILDQNGEMVFHTEAFPIAYGLTVQKYRSENYLTFWAGDDQVIGHGSGSYYMFDQHYRQYKKIDPVGNLTGYPITGDLHEFKITKENTALITSYVSIPWDLSALGRPKDSFIFDCLFQEIDIETNQLLFEWRATDHFTFDDCYNPVRQTGAANNPWDWFHINSVEKDKKGNYMISARYSHAITYIHGKTGQTLWHLGGKNNSFTDLSGGTATDFCWQHDARWVDNYEAITMFDNHAYFADQVTPARGLKVGIDTKKMTATTIIEAKHPQGYVSESQGSAQQLPNGNLFLGYGSAAAFAEYSPSGEILCDMQFGALHYHKDGSFSPSAVMSYRAYKNDWVGYPSQPPKVKFDEGKMYVSWNGATELKQWIVEGTNALGTSAGDWDMLGTIPRTGFESNVTLQEDLYRIYRLTALDKQQKMLGMWIVYSGGEVRSIPYPEASTSRSVSLVVFGAVLALCTIALFSRKAEIRHRIAGLLAGSGGRKQTGSTLDYGDVERMGLVEPEVKY